MIQGDSGITGPVGFIGQTGRKVNPPDYIISFFLKSHGWTMIPSADTGKRGPRNLLRDCVVQTCFCYCCLCVFVTTPFCAVLVISSICVCWKQLREVLLFSGGISGGMEGAFFFVIKEMKTGIMQSNPKQPVP